MLLLIQGNCFKYNCGNVQSSTLYIYIQTPEWTQEWPYKKDISSCEPALQTCLTTVSRISTEWKSSSLNRTVCGVIFNVRIGKDFGLKNSVFYIRTVLTENNKFLCIFSFTVFIVNEYFTTVTKLKICAHHLSLTIILSILKCITLYQVTIIPSYLYSEMRELKIFNTSHFVTWLISEL